MTPDRVGTMWSIFCWSIIALTIGTGLGQGAPCEQLDYFVDHDVNVSSTALLKTVSVESYEQCADMCCDHDTCRMISISEDNSTEGYECRLFACDDLGDCKQQLIQVNDIVSAVFSKDDTNSTSVNDFTDLDVNDEQSATTEENTAEPTEEPDTTSTFENINDEDDWSPSNTTINDGDDDWLIDERENLNETTAEMEFDEDYDVTNSTDELPTNPSSLEVEESTTDTPTANTDETPFMRVTEFLPYTVVDEAETTSQTTPNNDNNNNNTSNTNNWLMNEIEKAESGLEEEMSDESALSTVFLVLTGIGFVGFGMLLMLCAFRLNQRHHYTPLNP